MSYWKPRLLELKVEITYGDAFKGHLGLIDENSEVEYLETLSL